MISNSIKKDVENFVDDMMVLSIGRYISKNGTEGIENLTEFMIKTFGATINPIDTSKFTEEEYNLFINELMYSVQFYLNEKENNKNIDNIINGFQKKYKKQSDKIIKARGGK